MPGVKVVNYGACEYVNGRLIFHSEPTVVEFRSEADMMDSLFEERRQERVRRVHQVRRQLTESLRRLPKPEP